MLFTFVLLFLSLLHQSRALLCYNGTFTYKTHGEDPITYRGLLVPSLRTLWKTQCWNTISCSVWCADETLALLCYNCSSTQLSVDYLCAGDFASLSPPFNTSHRFLTNCTGENSMCFVRSWRARAKFAWIVQRGCYQAVFNDPVIRYLNKPTRAMTCTHRRLTEAEYKVCLCRADWCNSAHRPVQIDSFLVYVLTILYIFRFLV